MRVLQKRHPDKPRANPFRYGGVATGEYFTDRERELAELAGDLRSGQSVVVLSPRRYGKTSLITEVIARLRGEQALVAYVDVLRATTREQFASQLAAALFQGLVPAVDRAFQKAGELFQSLPVHPKITVSPDGSMSFEFTSGFDTKDLDQTIDRLLELPRTVAGQRKRRVVLVLDEFQKVIDLDPNLPARMRAIFQFQSEVAHVFIGSRQHLLRQVFTETNAPLYKSAKVAPLGPIHPEIFAPFIVARFAATGLRITDAAVDHLLVVTQGHPHDTQKLCYFTWAVAAADGRPASPETVVQALRQILAADGAHYIEVWDSLTPNQARMLEALAREGNRGGILAEEFRRRHRLGAYATAKRALDALLARGLVERVDREGVIVPDVFLRLWLAADLSSSWSL
ncbi:MAG: AAA family ATPase [Chloroflexi bacterium]|nr:AAA family ATPase [Chloroflexota bacterium]